MSIKFLNGIDVDNGVLYTDTSNNRVGINTSSPQVPLEVKYTGTIDEIVRIVGAASGKPQITFYNDTTLHTKIVAAGNNDFSITNTHSTGDMFFATNGADRLHIEANGNVGIGTTSPNFKLDIEGADLIRAFNPSGSASVQIKASTGNNSSVDFADPDDNNVGQILYRHANDSMSFDTNDIEKMRITSTGNVGIGTTSPSSKLQVDGEIDANGGDGYRIETKPFANWSSDLLTLGDWDGEGYSTRIMGSNSSEVMRVTGTNVGIGTSTPDYKLEVDGTIGVSRTDGIIFAGSAGTGYGNKITSDTSNNFIFSTSLPSAPYTVSERMRITNLGDVGIGITNTTAKLDVLNSGTAINAYSSQGVGLKIRGGGNSQDIAQFSNVGGTVVAALDSAGQLGIGTNDPQAELHVQSVTNGTPTIRLNHNSTYPAWMIEATQNNSASPPRGQLRWDANPGATGMQLVYWNSYTENALKLDGQNFKVINNGSERMRIDSTGDVGIGTTGPSEKLEVNGSIKASATTDAYKGYIKQNVNSFGGEKVENANYYFTSYNTTATVTSAQAYNRIVAAYSGRVKKVYIRHAGGSTPTATAVNFKKHTNGTTSSTVYSATVASGATANMSAYYEFGNNDFTFNAGDLVGLLYQTTDAFGTASKTMGQNAVTITLEYNIT